MPPTFLPGGLGCARVVWAGLRRRHQMLAAQTKGLAARLVKTSFQLGAASVQPCTSTRSTAKRRLCGQVLALPCNFNIRIPSLELAAWQLQPPRRPGWNNVLRNYT
jgi:hypothetical protein